MRTPLSCCLLVLLLASPSLAHAERAYSAQNQQTGHVEYIFTDKASVRMAPASNAAAGAPCTINTVPQGDKEGALRYNKTLNALEYCDGTTWKTMGSEAAVVCQASNKGAVRFNAGVSMMEYCNGVAWQLIGIIPQAAACAESTRGTTRYNVAEQKMEYCNGTAWVGFGSTLALDIDYTKCKMGAEDKTGGTLNNYHYNHFSTAEDRAPANDQNTNLACIQKNEVVVATDNGSINNILCCGLKLK